MPLVADVYDTVLQDRCKVQLSLDMVYMQHWFILSQYRAQCTEFISTGVLISP